MFAGHHEKSFVPSLFKVSVDHWLISVSLEKETIVLKKIWKKSWILDLQIVRTMFINNRLKANVLSFALKHNLFAQIDDNVT